MLPDDARGHAGDRVLHHSPADAVGEFRVGVLVGMPGDTDGHRVPVRFEGHSRDSDVCADHLTLLRGGSAREHFRLNLADTGFPMAGHPEEDFL